MPSRDSDSPSELTLEQIAAMSLEDTREVGTQPAGRPVLVASTQDILTVLSTLQPHQLLLVLWLLMARPIPSDLLAAMLESGDETHRNYALRFLDLVGPVSERLVEAIIRVATNEGAPKVTSDMLVGLLRGMQRREKPDGLR